jgi:hypothetical protein
MTRPRSPRVPRELLDLFEADDGRGEWTVREHARRPLELEADRRGTWTVREHSQLRQEWRERWGYIRRRPIMSSVVMLMFVLEMMTGVWLFGPR